MAPSRNSRPKLLLAGIVAVTALAGPSRAADTRYWIVVHPDNPHDTLSRDKVSELFLKKSTMWPDGSPATPIDLDTRVKTREEFSRDIHGRSVDAIKKYWQQMIFSGRAAPPAELATEEDVVSHVRTDPAAIGYVSEECVLRGVKILDVIDPSPAPPSEANGSRPKR